MLVLGECIKCENGRRLKLHFNVKCRLMLHEGHFQVPFALKEFHSKWKLMDTTHTHAQHTNSLIFLHLIKYKNGEKHSLFIFFLFLFSKLFIFHALSFVCKFISDDGNGRKTVQYYEHKRYAKIQSKLCLFYLLFRCFIFYLNN